MRAATRPGAIHLGQQGTLHELIDPLDVTGRILARRERRVMAASDWSGSDRNPDSGELTQDVWLHSLTEL